MLNVNWFAKMAKIFSWKRILHLGGWGGLGLGAGVGGWAGLGGLGWAGWALRGSPETEIGLFENGKVVSAPTI